MTEIEKKTGMTDAECEHLDNYYTEKSFAPGHNLLKLGVKPGFAQGTSLQEAHNTLLLNELDKDVAEYLHIQSKAFHKSQVEIINDLVREKLASTSVAVGA